MLALDEVWDQFEPRTDEHFGMQEFLALPLACETSRLQRQGVSVFIFVDHQGVVGALRRCTAVADDMYCVVGNLWLHWANDQIGAFLARVDPRGSIAGGPTRERFVLLQALGALFAPPRLPAWAQDL